MQVVLTGRCNVNSRFIERSEVCRRAGNAAIAVQATVTSGIDYLVASRDDTAKARRAREMGISVIGYPVFFRIIDAREAADRAVPGPTTGQQALDDIDDRARGRVQPITGPNGGRMGNMNGPAPIRQSARAKAAKVGRGPRRSAPRPHRMLDL